MYSVIFRVEFAVQAGLGRSQPCLLDGTEELYKSILCRPDTSRLSLEASASISILVESDRPVPQPVPTAFLICRPVREALQRNLGLSAECS